ncbi:hypothetical protein CCR75_007077 [Bremia lactucae]|uniref:Uncharacterized protein n=1 Tax=Bremia lactucae TaxID=4779 RepID=A0A976FGD4_BRELC|nr:hypothetical protein CCR75_007077 [Bremia lactucae]
MFSVKYFVALLAVCAIQSSAAESYDLPDYSSTVENTLDTLYDTPCPESVTKAPITILPVPETPQMYLPIRGPFVGTMSPPIESDATAPAPYSSVQETGMYDQSPIEAVNATPFPRTMAPVMDTKTFALETPCPILPMPRPEMTAPKESTPSVITPSKTRSPAPETSTLPTEELSSNTFAPSLPEIDASKEVPLSPMTPAPTIPCPIFTLKSDTSAPAVVQEPISFATPRPFITTPSSIGPIDTSPAPTIPRPVLHLAFETTTPANVSNQKNEFDSPVATEVTTLSPMHELESITFEPKTPYVQTLAPTETVTVVPVTKTPSPPFKKVSTSRPTTSSPMVYTPSQTEEVVNVTEVPYLTTTLLPEVAQMGSYEATEMTTVMPKESTTEEANVVISTMDMDDTVSGSLQKSQSSNGLRD